MGAGRWALDHGRWPMGAGPMRYPVSQRGVNQHSQASCRLCRARRPLRLGLLPYGGETHDRRAHRARGQPRGLWESVRACAIQVPAGRRDAGRLVPGGQGRNAGRHLRARDKLHPRHRRHDRAGVHVERARLRGADVRPERTRSVGRGHHVSRLARAHGRARGVRLPEGQGSADRQHRRARPVARSCRSRARRLRGAANSRRRAGLSVRPGDGDDRERGRAENAVSRMDGAAVQTRSAAARGSSVRHRREFGRPRGGGCKAGLPGAGDHHARRRQDSDVARFQGARRSP